MTATDARFPAVAQPIGPPITRAVPTAAEMARAALNVATLFAQHDVEVVSLTVTKFGAKYDGLPPIEMSIRVIDIAARPAALSIAAWSGPQTHDGIDIFRADIDGHDVTLYLPAVLGGAA